VGATEQIARFTVDARFSDLPPEAVKSAKEAILDGIGVTIAGSTESAGEIVTQYVRDQGGAAQAGVVGGGFRTSAPQAALANGVLAHALDFDDVIGLMSGHPTVPVLPAVLALAEAHGRSGADAILAYVVGVEVESRIGSAIGMHHYAVGWHPTATLGTLGSAAASAWLLGLGVAETRMALGIAASEASGLRQNFGSMTKPFHAGHAASCGVVAAQLAARGFTADDSILESRYGFFPVLGGEGQYDLEQVTRNLGAPFAVADPGLEMKPYPCCRFIHRCLDAVLQIVDEHHPDPADVTEVECRTSSFVPQIVIHHRPRTPLEGKFSMEYCMARALMDGEMRIAQFADDKVMEPAAQELLQRVKYVHPESVPGERAPERVTVRLRDGREMFRDVLVPRGAPQNPMSLDELVAKFRDCAGVALSADAVDRALDMILNLGSVDNVTDLADILTAASPSRVG
jgi:2-methylcitrate dehydratase PrpD